MTASVNNGFSAMEFGLALTLGVWLYIFSSLPFVQHIYGILETGFVPTLDIYFRDYMNLVAFKERLDLK